MKPNETTEHTPGKWRIGDAGYTIFGPPNGQPSPETIANVRQRKNAPLIAAAPDLLAACKAALSALDDDSEDVHSRAARQLCAIEAAREAIALAERGKP